MTIWKYSWLDSFPLLVTAAQISGNVWLAATWNERSPLQLLLLWPIFLLLFWYNPAIATHNFLHTPWFKFFFIDPPSAEIYTVNLGLPQTLYRFHHLNHHRYGNDTRGKNSLTRDHSSTYAFGKNGKHENVIAYCALGLFRRGTTEAVRAALRKGKWKQLCFELLVCFLGVAGYSLLSWRYLLLWFVPTFYFGWFLAHAENYYEHFGASPENRLTNSVSYYGRIYNLFLCNEGYHQEHHLRPQVHWALRPQVRERFSGELCRAGRVVSNFPPLLGFLNSRPA